MRWKPQHSVAIVTGASSGIGRALTLLLVQRGATVVAVARRGDRVLELQRDATEFTGGGRLLTLVGDITEPAVRHQTLSIAAEQRGGALDLLVNNAGIGAIGPFADATPERLRRIMEVNFFAPVEFIREALPYLKIGRAPVVCNIASVLGHRAVPNKSEYCASKFALHGISDSMRAEFKPLGIQVTLASPSTTSSEFFDSLIETGAGEASRSIGSWPPQRVARAVLAAIQARRSEVILSLPGKALVYADRLSPPLMNALLAQSPPTRPDNPQSGSL